MLIESSPGDRDMSIALNFKATTLHPSVNGWRDNLEDLMIRYFQEEGRPAIKLRVLSILEYVHVSCLHLHNESAMQAVLPYLGFLGNEDTTVQEVAINLLVKMVIEGNGNHDFDGMCNVIASALHFNESPGSPINSPARRRSSSYNEAFPPRRSTSPPPAFGGTLPPTEHEQRPHVVAHALVRLFKHQLLRFPSA